MKLDTQGTELRILKGGSELLKNNKIRHIQVEVEFVSLYKNQCLFCDVDSYLRRYGYYLHGLYEQYRHRDHPIQTMPLVFADALYSSTKISPS